ncbi:MAG: flagellin [Deltaproteobacteria bacterium]|jgi:flagellin|nr:flagellin [Deltaproteobacteria bacterium]
MALVVNHNMLAQNAARNLSTIYDRLGTSVQRLSSGLRINSAADDAAGLAIREMMRADIATMNQGIRNIADAISMIQTADGALSIIDEKLIRMKELAEQAATGTYTTAQREIINSEYQAMAAEIDRIANATNFNGIKLLDGSVTNQHGGLGIKIHFGVSNNSSEDYYFVNIGDSRATSSTGLRIGGDAKNDIWGQGGAAAGVMTGPGCCTAGFDSLTGASHITSGQEFAYGYNWDWKASGEQHLLTGKYLAGRYQVSSGASLQELISRVNAGTQSRVGIQISGGAILLADMVAVCIGDEAYYYGSHALAVANTTPGKHLISATAFGVTAQSLVSAINTCSKTYWAMYLNQNASLEAAEMVYVFRKDGGDFNSDLACDIAVDANAVKRRSALLSIKFENLQTGKINQSGTNLSLGGEHWGTMKGVQTADHVWNVTLNGRDVGHLRDLWITNSGELVTCGLNTTIITGMNRDSFVEIQNAADALWVGAEVRTQSSAQEALDAITNSINTKDKIRADLGALQNRLENTLANMTIQAENLQAAESRISDVDVATEMTTFTRNNVLAQAATSMLAQANSLSQLALSLLQ